MNIQKTLKVLCLAALLGTVAIFGPTLMTTNVFQKGLFNTLYEAIGTLFSMGILLLILTGIIIGCFFRAPFWAIGLASVAILPLWSLIDAVYAERILNLDRHNLLPFEWLIYLLFSLPAMVGALLGQQVIHKWKTKKMPNGTVGKV